jgi:LytS/YehU family sensor histidine kinase
MDAENNSILTHTEVFIYIFVEIVTTMPSVQRVIFKMGSWSDKLFFILLFGGFSIMGTALGIPLKEGVIANIRDFAPMLAGLTAGPLVGICVGLIGAIHRLFLGGFTAVSCAISSVLAGLVCGGIYHLNKGKLVGIIPAMAIAVFVEMLHGAVNLLIDKPFEDAWVVSQMAVPAMMIANSLGMAIGIILISNKIKEHSHKLE